MPRPELLILTGLHTAGTEAVIRRIQELDSDVAVLHHDLHDIADGTVRRRLRYRSDDVTTTLRLAHGCLSCTLREDVVPQLHALAGPAGPRRIILHLDPAVDPEQICWSLLNVPHDGRTVDAAAELRGVVTCVDAATWLDDATGDDLLGERGLAQTSDEEHTVAHVAVGQVELADLIVHTGRADAWPLARTDAVLARLAPAAARVPLADLDGAVFLAGPAARRGRPDDVHGPLLRGQPPLGPDCGVELVLFTARRPFHPERLHRAIDVLLDGVVRTRGRLWLATRPEAVLWLESAGGGLSVGHAGSWLAGEGAAAWRQASPERRALAALGWDPRFGDRSQDIVVITHETAPDEIDDALRGALLTDDELADGEEAWLALPDPFGRWHTDPCGRTAEVRPYPGGPASGAAGPT